jgi:hypothetical protein
VSMGCRSGPVLGVDVLLEEPGGQILPQFAGPLLTLVEGDELVLIFGSEHEVEGGGSMAEPALAEFVPLDIGVGLRIVHGGVSRWSRQGTPHVGYPIPSPIQYFLQCHYDGLCSL